MVKITTLLFGMYCLIFLKFFSNTVCCKVQQITKLTNILNFVIFIIKNMHCTAFWHFVQLILTVINIVWYSDSSPKRNKTPKSQQVCNGPEIHNLFCEVKTSKILETKTRKAGSIFQYLSSHSLFVLFQRSLFSVA